MRRISFFKKGHNRKPAPRPTQGRGGKIWGQKTRVRHPGRDQGEAADLQEIDVGAQNLEKKRAGYLHLRKGVCGEPDRHEIPSRGSQLLGETPGSGGSGIFTPWHGVGRGVGEKTSVNVVLVNDHQETFQDNDVRGDA